MGEDESGAVVHWGGEIAEARVEREGREQVVLEVRPPADVTTGMAELAGWIRGGGLEGAARMAGFRTGEIRLVRVWNRDQGEWVEFTPEQLAEAMRMDESANLIVNRELAERVARAQLRELGAGDG